MREIETISGSQTSYIYVSRCKELIQKDRWITNLTYERKRKRVDGCWGWDGRECRKEENTICDMCGPQMQTGATVKGPENAGPQQGNGWLNWVESKSKSAAGGGKKTLSSSNRTKGISAIPNFAKRYRQVKTYISKDYGLKPIYLPTSYEGLRIPFCRIWA